MKSSNINYLIERQDVNNNWHLIETSENVLHNLLGDDRQILGAIKKYSNHAPLCLIDGHAKVLKHFGSYINNKNAMEDINILDMNRHSFNPLTQHCLIQISNEWENFYHRFRCQSFEKIITSLKSTNEPVLHYYSELLLKSTEYFSKLDSLTYVKSEKNNIDQSLSSLISAHNYLKLIGSEFEENNLSKFRMIVHYKT